MKDNSEPEVAHNPLPKPAGGYRKPSDAELDRAIEQVGSRAGIDVAEAKSVARSYERADWSWHFAESSSERRSGEASASGARREVDQFASKSRQHAEIASAIVDNRYNALATVGSWYVAREQRSAELVRELHAHMPEPQKFEIDGAKIKGKTFTNLGDAMQEYAKLERHDHSLTMLKGGKTAYLATTDWQNDGSTPVGEYHSPAVEAYYKAQKSGAPFEELRKHERAAQADLDAWPRTVKRDVGPPATAERSLNIHEGERFRAERQEPPTPARSAPPSTAPQKEANQVDRIGLTLPAQLERKYLRVGDDLFRSGRDDKPDMSIKGQDGIRINKDHAIGDAVAIAKHNGWQSIRVHGSDDFKKAVYLEAARAGVAVKDFEPSPQLKLEGERLAARDKAREAQDPTKRASMAKQDPTESRAAAEQFRRNSHRENATDPQFKAAQSHVLAASIEAKTRFPKKEDQARYIENAKETVAKRIENGGPIPAARFEQQRQNEATRIAREDTVLRQQERKPSRSR